MCLLFAHPHDPNEEDGVAEGEETDGKVVEQGLREPRLEEEGALELGQRLRPGLVVVLCHHDMLSIMGVVVVVVMWASLYGRRGSSVSRKRHDISIFSSFPLQF